MAGLRIFILFLASGLFMQNAWASVDKPLPEIQSLYASGYEREVFLSVMNNERPVPLKLLLSNAGEMDRNKEEQLRMELDSFVRKMKRWKERTSSEQVFLQKLFYKVHRKYLKEYKLYHNFYTLLDKGTYNCLSGTALYALLLDELDFSYRIFETDYHVFLLVRMDEGGEVLIESTDPLNGFLTEKEEIEQRIEDIKQDVLAAEQVQGKDYYDFKLKVFRSVDLQQLAGLQYFNQAADLYNKKQLVQAERALNKGRILYPAERFDQFARLLVRQ